jgi:hypothetical protein
MKYIPLVVAEIIGSAAFGGIYIGEVVKIKAFALQHRTMDIQLPRRVYSLQNAAVFAQGVIDIPHKVITAAVLPVVKTCAAFVGAEFFIGPAPYLAIAFQTCPLFHLSTLT